ncbi:MAG: cytochrome c-type biogenesis protein [Gammaproteobacteria bacterium]
MKIRLLLLPLLGVLWATSAGAVALSDYEFKDAAQVERFRILLKELRCLVCQNQTLANSDAPLAKDFRKEVHVMMQQGRSDREIIDFMVERYGDFVLYRPPVRTSTYLLWFGPFALLIFGGFVLLRTVRARGKPAARALSAADRERVRTALDDLGDGESR